MARTALTAKQEAFVQQYLLDLNATQAAIRAGYSAKTAESQGSTLLRNPKVALAVQEARQRTSERLELTRDDVIRQYQRIGFSDPRKIFDAYGQIKAITDLDDDTAAAIQGIDVEMKPSLSEDGEPISIPVLKVKMADRKSALDSIMKAQGWNVADKVEVTGKNGGAIEHQVTARVVVVPSKNPAPVETRPMTDDEAGL